MRSEVSDRIFREYDIRGIYGDDLTCEIAELLGRAYAVYTKRITGLHRPKVTVGRDARLSSDLLRDALVRGLTAKGVDCIDLGMCPTPLQYFSMHTLDVNGGIMITGSHNPPEYNGFKVSVGKETLHGESIQRLREIIQTEDLSGDEKEPGRVSEFDIISSYIDFHSSRFDIPSLSTPLRVVVDAGNGTAGPVAPELLRRLGCEVIELFCEPDGSFPNHHPDPTVAENLRHLIDRVTAEKADLGVAYDGDADRIGVVDERGRIVWGDQLMIIFARDILKTTPGAIIVGEVKCSQIMYDEIERLGGNAVMWKTGHSLIKAKMKELGAAVAGEMSGHIFFADRYFGFDDAIYSTCRLIEILAKGRKSQEGLVFSDLLSGLPQTFVTPEMRIECPEEKKFGVIDRLKESITQSDGLRIKDIITIDGVRIIFEGGWALVRASNTQPVLVLRYEAESKELLNRIEQFVRSSLQSAGCQIP